MLKFRECIRYPRVDVEDADAGATTFHGFTTLTRLAKERNQTNSKARERPSTSRGAQRTFDRR